MKTIAELETPVAMCCAPIAGSDLTVSQARATADLFKALADPTRVRMVNVLANSDSPVCVCEINDYFDLSQPTISHHLKKLVAAGVLDREQRGTWAYFSVNKNALSQLSDVFEVGKAGVK
jgi:ArsR family transcriptional regulator